MMDYHEAIKEAEIQIDMYESMILYNRDFEPKNDNSNYERKIDFLKTAISVMQELHAIHNNGISLERLKDIDFRKQVVEHINCIDYMDIKDELEEYKQIGTLEEVREAVEKQKMKKPCTSNRCYVCPHCGLVASLKIKHNYCDACGQHIDWSDEE